MKKSRSSGTRKSGSKSVKPAQMQEKVSNAGAAVNGKFSVKKILIFLLGVFIVFNIVEVYFFLGKSFKKQKSPVLVNSWDHNYQGCTSIAEYGQYIYGIDNTRGDVYINKKDTGELVKKLTFKEGVVTVAEDSGRNIYVLDRSNEVLKLDPKSFKMIKKIKPEGAGDIGWMDIDSKDNFYFMNPASSVIFKYSPGFEKILSFGGRTAGKEGFSNAGKVFISPKDDVYCMDHLKDGKMDIKIFSNDGVFKDSWQVKGIKVIDGFISMAIVPNGDVYMNVLQEKRIYAYSAKGELLGSFNEDDRKSFEIGYTASITGGKDGLIYVCTQKIGIFRAIDYNK